MNPNQFCIAVLEDLIKREAIEDEKKAFIKRVGKNFYKFLETQAKLFIIDLTPPETESASELQVVRV